MYSEPVRLRGVLTDLESQFGPALFRDCPKEIEVAFSMRPLTFTADPSTGQILATSYAASITISSDEGRCTAAIESYRGTMTFAGQS